MSPNFYYSSALWTNSAEHSEHDSTWQRTERKTAAASQAAAAVRLEMERQWDGSTTAVVVPITPAASLESIFNGPYLETFASEADWRALSGEGHQLYICRQGFNIQGQTAYGSIGGQSEARLGVYFSESPSFDDQCHPPSTGRVVGGTTRSARAVSYTHLTLPTICSV